jgi:hypothetical protein
MIGSKGDSGYQFLLMIFLSIENISQAGFIFEHFIKNS